MTNAADTTSTSPGPRRHDGMMLTGVTLAVLGALLYGASLFAETQSLNDRQPWFSRLAGQEATLTEISAKGATFDPYEDTAYVFRTGPYSQQKIHHMTVPARPENADGIIKLLRRDALHRHGRTELAGLKQPEGETHLWINYPTVRRIRELTEIDPHDQAALNQWATRIQEEPYDIDPQRDRRRFQPTWAVSLGVEPQQGPITSRFILEWTLIAAALTMVAGGGLLVLARSGRRRRFRSRRRPASAGLN